MVGFSSAWSWPAVPNSSWSSNHRSTGPPRPSSRRCSRSFQVLPDSDRDRPAGSPRGPWREYVHVARAGVPGPWPGSAGPRSKCFRVHELVPRSSLPCSDSRTVMRPLDGVEDSIRLPFAGSEHRRSRAPRSRTTSSPSARVVAGPRRRSCAPPGHRAGARCRGDGRAAPAQPHGRAEDARAGQRGSRAVQRATIAAVMAGSGFSRFDTLWPCRRGCSRASAAAHVRHAGRWCSAQRKLVTASAATRTQPAADGEELAIAGGSAGGEAGAVDHGRGAGGQGSSRLAAVRARSSAEGAHARGRARAGRSASRSRHLARVAAPVAGAAPGARAGRRRARRARRRLDVAGEAARAAPHLDAAHGSAAPPRRRSS